MLGLDALTYALLAVIVIRAGVPASRRAAPIDQAASRGGLALLRFHPELLGLLMLTWLFNLLYGPVEVALPLHVTDDLDAPGTLLGLYWMLFGIGAVLGSLAAGTLRQLPLWPVTIVIVVGWGLSLVPFGLGAPTALTVACFMLGGAIYGPFVALSVTLAGKVATTTPRRDARSSQRGAAHRLSARHRDWRAAHHGAGPARHSGRLRTRNRGARGRRVRSAFYSTQEPPRA